ncbi:glycosyl hydrolase [Massariosphaeria phaeospora]|uniref:Glycosyl hydrolase n=1 Tax=Massariosphaeria phaeospora TaxID=100035 RepID=A0A7C8I1G4_9PLEO|nr:glycosyl hydrolase [Massariosphaeria phaeospora]
MRGINLIGLAAAFASGASAACSAPLIIDDFSQWASAGNQNSLGAWTSTDGSMEAISGSNGVISFTPKYYAYHYENMPCQAAKSNGYDSIQFTIKGPVAGSSCMLEIQTKSSCADTGAYTQNWAQITGLTGATQTITLPFSAFGAANGDAVVGLVWSTWSDNTPGWQLSNVRLGCGGAASGTTRAPSSTTKAATSVGTITRTTLATSAAPSGSCAPLLIDDWTSQSRLTFLFYNALLEPTSDDGTMTSLEVNKPSKNRVTITPKDTSSYFYSQLGCTNAKDRYGGISLRIKAAAGTTLSIQLESSVNCDTGSTIQASQTSQQLGWTFDNTEKLYTIPFNKFSNLDTGKLVTLFISGISKPVSFGPMAFYCGSTAKEYIVSTTSVAAGPSSTVAAPTGTAAALVVDKFANANQNALGFWHGGDEGMTTTYANGRLTIKSTDADYSFYTQVSGSCSDFTKYKGSYLHIAYSGSTKFTVALQQHNSKCDAAIAPYPETWDSAEATRYAKDGHIYIPMNHFNVNLARTIGIAIKGFYSAETVTFSVIEIVASVPRTFVIPNKLETGDLVFACKRPNSFAFAIDDGQPQLAAEVMDIIKSEGIKVTFFTVGAPLLDKSTNLTNVYRDMQAQGHQIALHSYTHPKMEGLPDVASIDWEYNEDIKAVKQQLNGLASPYFRPPFGNEGARMRARLANSVGTKPTITMWSVDVEDWLWAETDTPEEQLKAFQRDVDKGGDLVVLHYLYPSTVSYLRQFIQIAKKTGKQLMRVDQCMNDPNAPPL